MATMAGGAAKKKMMGSGNCGEGFGSEAAQIGCWRGCDVGGARN